MKKNKLNPVMDTHKPLWDEGKFNIHTLTLQSNKIEIDWSEKGFIIRVNGRQLKQKFKELITAKEYAEKFLLSELEWCVKKLQQYISTK